MLGVTATNHDPCGALAAAASLRCLAKALRGGRLAAPGPAAHSSRFASDLRLCPAAARARLRRYGHDSETSAGHAPDRAWPGRVTASGTVAVRVTAAVAARSRVQSLAVASSGVATARSRRP